MNKKFYGELTFDKDNNSWHMDNIEPHVAIKLKQIFTKIAKYAVAPFIFENTPEICNDLEWFIHRYPLKMSDSNLNTLIKMKEAYEENINYLNNIFENSNSFSTSIELKPGQVLREYQIPVGLILKNNKILICGDSVGLGKTYSGIGAIIQCNEFPAAVVVQSYLTKQWQQKILEFSNLKVHIIKKSMPYPLPHADVYIFKYGLLKGWVDIFKQGIFKIAVFDEIQELRRGTQSEKGSGANVLCQYVNYKLGLSATPIYNYGDEIFNIYDILQNGILGNREEFYREWGSLIGDKLHIKDPNALGSYLRDKFIFLRRTKHSIKQYLPDINKLVYEVQYDEGAVKSIEEIAKVLAIKTLNGSFIERGAAARELDLLLRHYTGVSKAKYVAEFVKVFLENQEPVLLVGWHRDVYEIWLEILKDYNPVMFTGSETEAQKIKSKEMFIKGETNLMIISLRSGIGLDGLQDRCSVVIFGELDWSPQVHTQVIGRLHREGQKETVDAIFLTSEYGSDPLMIDMLGIKTSISEGVINPENIISNEKNDESRLKRLANNILTKFS